MKIIIFFLSVFIIGVQLQAQNVEAIEIKTKHELNRKEIRIPNIPGYQTLKCDLHMHTIFSDGSVWPTVRVEEAYAEGLDAIAIADHIENEPRKKFVGGDKNSPYEIALPKAEKLNVLLIKAGEISRKMPPGHLNALFVNDVNKLDTENYMEAVEEANKQGGFVFWNHPAWPQNKQPDSDGWWDVHEKMYTNGWLHGIEVFNMDEYFPIAVDWCADKGLAFMANSDVHEVSSHTFDYEKYMRPMTLVFAKERTLESIKEALFAKRSVACFANQLAGQEHLLKEIFKESLIINKPFKVEGNEASFQLVNSSDVPIVLHNDNPEAYSPKDIKIKSGSSVIVQCILKDGKANLPYKVTNFRTRADKTLNVILKIQE